MDDVGREVCSVKDCEGGFNYDEVGGYKTGMTLEEATQAGAELSSKGGLPCPRGWGTFGFRLPRELCIGFLCPQHVGKFPTGGNRRISRKLEGLLDRERMHIHVVRRGNKI